MALLSIGNPVIGDQSVQFPPVNSKGVCRFQNTYAHTINVKYFYGAWTINYPTAKVKAVIYADNAGAPGALLGTSDEKIGIRQTTVWDAFTFSVPVSVTAGAFVWIGVISDTQLISQYCLATGIIKYNGDTYSDGPSASFGAASSANYTYPMWIEGDDGQPRFGRASIDAGAGNYQPDREHGDLFELGGTDSVSVVSISTYVLTTSATAKCKAAVFEDNAGFPGDKIAQTVETTGTTAGSWLVLNFAVPFTLPPGRYWLCFISDTNLVTPTIPHGGALRADGNDAEATAFSSPSSLLLNLAPVGIDIFATYTTIPSSVTFDGIPATNVVEIDANTIGCDTPAHAAGVVDVVATFHDGVELTAPGGYTYEEPEIPPPEPPPSGTGTIKPIVRYRTFRSDDLTKPLFGPVKLEIGTVAMKREGSSFEAKAPSLSLNRTGETYDLDRFPGLRGLL